MNTLSNNYTTRYYTASIHSVKETSNGFMYQTNIGSYFSKFKQDVEIGIKKKIALRIAKANGMAFFLKQF